VLDKGRGGESIYGGLFPMENDNGLIMHDEVGLLSMADIAMDEGTGRFGSQFFVLSKPARHLDGKQLVFGHLIDGVETLKLIMECAHASGKPTGDVFITNCGELDEAGNEVAVRRKKKSAAVPFAAGEGSSVDSS
jgi:cyclophilin family peptidyl-prolyl cis-trans isomerase